MRVAVRHTDKKHPNHDWFAFEQGRITGFSNPLSGESASADEVADALLARAQEQYPEDEGYEHRIETLHVTGQDENGDEESGWFEQGKSKLPRAGLGSTGAQSLTVDQGQESAAA